MVICKMSYLMLIGQVGIKNVDNTSKEKKCGVKVAAIWRRSDDNRSKSLRGGSMKAEMGFGAAFVRVCRFLS